MFKFAVEMADRMLARLVPELTASACCSGTGMHFCCQNKECPVGSTQWTCTILCDCHLLVQCVACSS